MEWTISYDKKVRKRERERNQDKKERWGMNHTKKFIHIANLTKKMNHAFQPKNEPHQFGYQTWSGDVTPLIGSENSATSSSATWNTLNS
jgi:hypothetical protein